MDELHGLDGPAAEVAPGLLGMVLRRHHPRGVVSVLITEVEAYDGANDPASHAYRGRTARNEAMFGPAGVLYVYRSHGLHWCANVVTGPDGVASAVLLRAGRLLEGAALARERRGDRVSERDLTRGPGRLCQALDLSGEQYGADLLAGGPVSLEFREPPAARLIRSGPRIGVSKAAEVPWRFWIDGEPSVSAYRRSPRA